MPIHLSEDHVKLAEQFNKQHIGILATSSPDATPHAATIYFYADDDFNIYFLTKESTTKHKNLQQNPKASLAIFEAAAQKTVQVSGTATKIDDMDQFTNIYNRIHAIAQDTSYHPSMPISQLDAGAMIAYCLHPDTIRLAEFFRTDQQIADGVGIFDVVELPKH